MAEIDLLDWAVKIRAFYVGINTRKNEDMGRGVSICTPDLCV